MLYFVRYGGLSSVRQDGYQPSMPTFHCPPARRGIYAFVAQTIELFLLGQEAFDSRRAEWVRDNAGQRIPSGSELAKQLTNDFESSKFISRTAKDGQRYLARHKKPRRFTYSGVVWCHLPVPRNEILEEKGCWTLTTAPAHERAFWKSFNKRLHAVDLGHPSLLLDDFEVFIEKL